MLLSSGAHERARVQFDPVKLGLHFSQPSPCCCSYSGDPRRVQARARGGGWGSPLSPRQVDQEVHWPTSRQRDAVSCPASRSPRARGHFRCAPETRDLVHIRARVGDSRREGGEPDLEHSATRPARRHAHPAATWPSKQPRERRRHPCAPCCPTAGAAEPTARGTACAGEAARNARATAQNRRFGKATSGWTGRSNCFRAPIGSSGRFTRSSERGGGLPAAAAFTRTSETTA